MKKYLQRQLKFILFSSIIFYVGFFLIGIVPYHFYDILIWDSNLFLRIIGGILGFTMTITMMSNIYVSFTRILPYKTLSNFIVISNIIFSLFVIDIVFSFDQSGISLSLAANLFMVVGSIVIISNIINLYVLSKSNQEELVDNWKRGMSNFQSNHRGFFRITKAFTYILVFVVLFDFSMSSYMDYVLLFAFASYVIYNYYKSYNLDMKKISLVTTIFILLSAISIFILISNKLFLDQHVVLRGLVFLLPYLHISTVILPDAYKQMWQDIDNKIFS